jgi:hypothetical protein
VAEFAALDHDSGAARGHVLDSRRLRRDEAVAQIDCIRPPFTIAAPGVYGGSTHLLQLIAPRPLLVISGDLIRTPLPGVQESVAAARLAYAGGCGRQARFYLQPNAGHVFTPVVEPVMADWFVKWLAPRILCGPDGLSLFSGLQSLSPASLQPASRRAPDKTAHFGNDFIPWSRVRHCLA